MKDKHLEWKTSYLIGIEAIDLQHQYFIGLINRLSDELDSSDNLNYQLSLLSELKPYARFHFISEENMMHRANFPQLEQHKTYHRDLLEKLSSKSAMYEIDRSTDHRTEIIDFLYDWFTQHTVSEDKQFAEFCLN